MDDLNKVLEYIQKKCDLIDIERNDDNKKRIEIYTNNIELKKQYQYLKKLDKNVEILKKIITILSIILTIYISDSILLSTLNNTFLIIVSTPAVYISSNVIIKYIVNNILYHFKNQTITSLPIQKELIEKTLNDNETKLSELDIKLNKEYEILSDLNHIYTQIYNYKDEQEVEIEFYDIEEKDNIIKFENKPFTLIKKNNKKDNK